MDTLALAAALLIGLPFWFAGFWALYRRDQAARMQRTRLLARIGVPVEAEAAAQKRHLPLAQQLELRLQQAGLAGAGRRFTLWMIGTATLLGALGLAAGATLGPTAALAAGGVAASGPFYVLYRIVVRRRRFAEQLPDALEAMVRALQAGNTIDAALRMVAEDFAAPLKEEFARMSQQVQLGVPLSGALRDFQRRVGIAEAQYFVATLIVQRETGGQLAEVLAQLARIMRRRALFQGKLKALTAESRFTAWFIGGSPLAFLAYKYLFDRPAMTFFLEDATGQGLFQFAVGMIVAGALLLRQLMRIRF